MSDLAALSGWRARLRLVREHLVPPVSYMQKIYPCSSVFMPFAYAHRIIAGAWRWLRRARPATPSGSRSLQGEAVLLLVGVRIALKILPYRVVRRLLDCVAGMAADGASVDGFSPIVGAVAVASRQLSGTTCLINALAADAMLRRRGCTSTIRIGVRRPGQGSTELEGHAWLEHRGTVILGAIDNLSDYLVMWSPADEPR
jgi:hypothetical protein